MVISESPSITANETTEAVRTAKPRAVNIAGRGSDIAFIIDEDAPMEQVERDLTKQLSERRGALFSEGGVSVNTGSRILTAGEKAAIRSVFEEHSGLKVSRFISTMGDYALESDEDLEETSRRYPWRYSTGRSPGRNGAFPAAGRGGGEERNRPQTMLIRSTFRSGESLHHYGDVVVLGDVNPGSEIKADGDIVVMGALKGLPHAGASGDNKAAIIALEIASPRLRIGSSEAVTQGAGKNQKGKKRGRNAEARQMSIAYTRRGAIYISPFAGRFARYAEGVPYDG